MAERPRFVPYRDSPLTRLLRDSLGGNAVTTWCATCGPAAGSHDETLATLLYASRVQTLHNRPRVNERPCPGELEDDDGTGFWR